MYPVDSIYCGAKLLCLINYCFFYIFVVKERDKGVSLIILCNGNVSRNRYLL